MTDTKSLLYKATFSASAGLPISYLLNITILPLFITELRENVLIAGALIAIPFLMASTIRIFVIDYIYQRHGINLDPAHLLKKAVRHTA